MFKFHAHLPHCTPAWVITAKNSSHKPLLADHEPQRCWTQLAVVFTSSDYRVPAAPLASI